MRSPIQLGISEMKAHFILASVAFFILQSCSSNEDIRENGDSDAGCSIGSLAKEDFLGGEISLKDDSIRKIDISEQSRITIAANGRKYFKVDAEDRSRFDLPENQRATWHFARSYGYFGRNDAESELNFSNNIDPSAKYYPHTKKLVLYTSSPYIEGAEVSWFWVLVNVTDEAENIVFECSQYR